MPEIVFDQLVKRFAGTTVIDHVSAVVPDQEFLVLVGPSGCGKSTMLRMIAGLTEVTAGSVRFNGKAMNGVPARDRDVAFVFQSYALYPHLTVRANIAFPLIMQAFRWWYHIPILSGFMRRRMMNAPAIRQKVESVAAMLRLTPLLDRRPASLSGGQRQRVAVARALVREPSVYLLDEPLSNLDAALRTQMRAEITALHRTVKKNFIYVTHDQVEAMTMGTRIVILDKGVVQQYATPKEIYETPANTFVARFIGVPPMNLLPAVLKPDGQLTLTAMQQAPGEGQSLIVGLRPEMIELLPFRADRGGVRGTVVSIEYLGAESIVAVRLGAAAAQGIVQEDDTLLQVRLGESGLAVGEACLMEFNFGRASFFDSVTGNRIEPPAEVIRISAEPEPIDILQRTAE